MEEKEEDVNVFGEKLISCSEDPMTGFYRNGCCSTGPNDRGTHTVCAVMDASFLRFTKAMGNDLSTPLPEHRFPGLKPGDRWCLCASRWKEALEHGAAPKVILEATHEKTLEIIPMEHLLKYALRKQD